MFCNAALKFMPASQYSFFLSFAGEDRAIALKLRDAIDEAAAKSWGSPINFELSFIDDVHLAQGDAVWQKLGATINNSIIFVALVGKHYLHKKPPLTEFRNRVAANAPNSTNIKVLLLPGVDAEQLAKTRKVKVYGEGGDVQLPLHSLFQTALAATKTLPVDPNKANDLADVAQRLIAEFPSALKTRKERAAMIDGKTQQQPCGAPASSAVAGSNASATASGVQPIVTIPMQRLMQPIPLTKPRILLLDGSSYGWLQTVVEQFAKCREVTAANFTRNVGRIARILTQYVSDYEPWMACVKKAAGMCLGPFSCLIVS